MTVNTENLLRVGQGKFELNRLPKRPLELLRAWDAADEYLLNTLAEDLKLQPDDARILIFNDSFGALAVALNPFQPQGVSDSYLSQQATRLNLAGNGLPVTSTHPVVLFPSKRSRHPSVSSRAVNWLGSAPSVTPTHMRHSHVARQTIRSSSQNYRRRSRAVMGLSC